MNTQHKQDCKMAFGRKDESCPRCQELLKGAPARDGWHKAYYTQKKRQDEMRLLAIRNHNCVQSNCGPVCTFGDW